MSVADCERRLPRRSGARPRYPSSLTCGNDGGPISPFGPLGFFRSFRGLRRGCERPPANPFKARIPRPAHELRLPIADNDCGILIFLSEYSFLYLTSHLV